MSHSNISIFVPHVGCPHSCAFCDQRTITGVQKIPHAEDVRTACRQAMGEIKSRSETEIAFFGGSFTAIPKSYMIELLGAAKPFVGGDRFKGIRVSTRPDCIDDEVLTILKEYSVTSIELGAQSMNREVLEANERGHTADDVRTASEKIRRYGFELGLQTMVGLYRSDRQKELETMRAVLDIMPDTVRIYPIVILDGTRLAELYKSGEYEPVSFDEVVEICAEMLESYERQGIRVIKCGLHASEFVERDMVGGFYHPAFRELCEGMIYRKAFEREIEKCGKTVTHAHFSVDKRQLSKAKGQKKANIQYFKDKGIEIKISAEEQIDEKYVTVSIW